MADVGSIIYNPIHFYESQLHSLKPRITNLSQTADQKTSARPEY